mmetsp:Transcript_18271/g.35902  ORF Transcript_18271/g.35902 Transcript_18271/m.35902 type:complete len:105 (-) Transcript_18271:55-369(-)
MLHPKENLKDKKLFMHCKNCNYEDEAQDPYIYVNKMKKNAAMRLDLIDTELARDPTLPRTFNTRCPHCKGKEACMMMNRSGGKDSDMSLIFICANDACLHKWLG